MSLAVWSKHLRIRLSWAEETRRTRRGRWAEECCSTTSKSNGETADLVGVLVVTLHGEGGDVATPACVKYSYSISAFSLVSRTQHRSETALELARWLGRSQAVANGHRHADELGGAGPPHAGAVHCSTLAS